MLGINAREECRQHMDCKNTIHPYHMNVLYWPEKLKTKMTAMVAWCQSSEDSMNDSYLNISNYMGMIFPTIRVLQSCASHCMKYEAIFQIPDHLH